MPLRPIWCVYLASVVVVVSVPISGDEASLVIQRAGKVEHQVSSAVNASSVSVSIKSAGKDVSRVSRREHRTVAWHYAGYMSVLLYRCLCAVKALRRGAVYVVDVAYNRRFSSLPSLIVLVCTLARASSLEQGGAPNKHLPPSTPRDRLEASSSLLPHHTATSGPALGARFPGIV